MFQEKGWCDKAIMKKWVASDWANVFTSPHSASSTGKIWWQMSMPLSRPML